MRRYTGRALLGAAALAIEAYSRISPAGAAFLALFLAWGVVATRPALGPPRAAARFGLVLWSTSAALACVALLLQLLLPLLATDGVGPGSVLWRVLGLRDLSQCTVWELLAVLLPPLLCALTALAEAQDAYTACFSSGGGGAARDGAAQGNGGGGAHGNDTAAPRSVQGDDGGGGAVSDAGDSAASSNALASAGRNGAAAAGVAGAASSSSSSGAADSKWKAGQGTAATAAAAAAAGSAAASGFFLVLAALLWPAVFNVPWLLIASAAIAMWALRMGLPPYTHSPLLRLFQLYCGACLVAVYGWQLQPTDAWPADGVRAARALGLYRLDPSAAPLYDVVPQVLHIVALTALYGALGFAAKAAAEGWRRCRMRHVTLGSQPHPSAAPEPPSQPLEPPSSAALWSQQAPAGVVAGAVAVKHGDGGGGGEERDELHPQRQTPPQQQRRQQPQRPQQLQQQRHHQHHRGGGGGSALVARVADRASAGVEAVCAHPGVAAVSLACLSMVEVSVVGGVLLAVGMWTLLAPGRYGRRLLRRCSPALIMLLLAWNTAVYVITCLSASYPQLLPPVLHSIGLFMYDSPPPVVLPLAGQALAILAMAGLARSRTAGSNNLYGSSGSSGGRDGVGSTGSGNDVGGARHASSAGSSVGGRGGRTSVASSPLGLTLVLALYHMLHVLVPSSWILLGSYRLDLLHGAYLLCVLSYCGSTALRLSPDPRVGSILPDITQPGDEAYGDGGGGGSEPTTADGAVSAWPPLAPRVPQVPPRLPAAPPAHRLLRLYASVHLLALYAAMCGQLPGLGFTQREEWRHVLQLVGLLAPTRTADCLPLLGALVLATAHAVAGKVLVVAAASAKAAAEAEAAAAGGGGGGAAVDSIVQRPPPQVQGWLLALGSLLGSAASSVGYWLVAVLLYVLVLYDTHVGLLGLGYVALGLPLLLAPPRRGQYVWRLRLSHHRSSLHPQQPHLQLSSLGLAHSAAANAPWLAPAALALYSAADLCMSYTAATMSVYGPPGDGPGAAGSAEWWWRLVSLLYGGPPEAPGARLVLALARPACLLLALQLYRWTFAAAAVSKWMRRHGGCVCCSSERDTPLLQPLLPQHQHQQPAPASAARRVAKQEYGAWFVKRWLILNLDFFTTVLLFAALMASPGVLSAALLAAGVVAAMTAAWRAAAVARGRARGGSGGGGPARVGDAAAAVGFFAAVQLVLAGWLMTLYALQLEPVAMWLRSVSEPGDDGGDGGYVPWSPAAVADWLGLPPCDLHDAPPPPSTSIKDLNAAAGGGLVTGRAFAVALADPLRRLLRAGGSGGGGGFGAGGGGDAGGAECSPAPGLRLRLELQLLTMAALALRGKAHRWRSKLPHEVVAAAAPGQPCCLFWPPPSARPDSAVLPWLGPRAPLQRAVRRALAPAAAVANQVLSRLGRGAYDVLKAMDVPADELVPAGGGDVEGEEDVEDERRPLLAPPPPAPRRDASSGGGSGGGRQAQPTTGPVGAAATAAAVDSLPPAVAQMPATNSDNAASGRSGNTETSPAPEYGTQSTGAGRPYPGAANAFALAAAHSGRSAFGAGAVGGGNGGGNGSSGWLLFVRLAVRGCLELWEGAWAAWGGEVALLALLLAAFMAASALSLLLLAALGAGMAASLHLNAVLRRHAVLPMLGVLLLYQYCAWVGLPRLLLPALGRPPPYPAPSQLMQLPPALAAWLGLQAVGSLLPWALFGALSACIMQVNSELGQDLEAAPEATAAAASASEQRPGRQRDGPWFLRHRWLNPLAPGPDDDNDLEAPLLPPPSPSPSPSLPPPPAPYIGPGDASLPAAQPVPTEQVPQRSGEGGHTRSSATASGAVLGVRHRPEPMHIPRAGRGMGRIQAPGYGGGGCRTFLFSPVEIWAQPRWGVLDWARYYLVRHAADLLLVVVVGLVALQRDLLRAGYLAHCLLLFRRRPELARPGGAGGALFGRLVVFNYLVLMLEGAFQAPWELLLGPTWAQPCTLTAPSGGEDGGGEGGDGPAVTPACTFPRLMGLCQLQPGRGDDGGAEPEGWRAGVPTHGTAAPWRRLLGGGAGAAGVWGPWSALLDSPVVADVVVWLLLRLYVRVLRSPLFARVTRLAAEAQQQHVAALRLAAKDGREAAARGALASSHARAVRLRRIAKLKALLLSAGDIDASDLAGPGRANATAAYLSALRTTGGGGGGGGGGGSGLLSAAGGGPMVAGLAELLDADVDIADVAAAAGSGAGLQRGGRRHQHRQYDYHRGGGGGVGYHLARDAAEAGGVVDRDGGGSDREGAFGRSSRLAQGFMGDDGEEYDLSGAATGGARALAHRRTRSYTHFEDLEHDAASPSPRAEPSSTSMLLVGPWQQLLQQQQQQQRQLSLERPERGRQRSSGLTPAHRRHMSADILELFSSQAAPGAVPERDGATAASEIEPYSGAAAGPPPLPRSGALAAAAAAGPGRRRRRLSWPPLLVRLYDKLVAPLVTAARRRRPDDDSYTCYAAFLVLFLLDMSALAAVLPLSMFMYGLLLHRKPRQYWQGALLYAETVLILQYSYLVLGKCLCATGSGGGGGGAAGSSCMWLFGRREFLFRVQVAGLHSDPLRALPLFVSYLATLMHSYSLDLVYAAVAAPPQHQAAAAPSSGPASHPAGAAAPQPESPPLPVCSFRHLHWRVRQAASACRLLALHLWRVYGLVTHPHEVGPHWVKLQLALPQQRRATPAAAAPPAPAAGDAGASGGAISGATDGVSPLRRGTGLPPRPPSQPPPSPPPPPPDVGGAPAAGAPPAAAPAALPPLAAEEADAAAAAPPLPEFLGTAAEDIPSGAGGEVAPGGHAALVLVAAPPLRPPHLVLRGHQLAAALQQLLAAVHQYGQRVAAAKKHREEWRRRTSAWQFAEMGDSDSSSDEEGEERHGAGGEVAAGGKRAGGAAESAAVPAAADSSDSTAAAIFRLARYSLPQLRLQHEAVAPVGTAVHVLLEVVPPPAPMAAAWADGGGASPIPAHDVAAMLCYAAEAASRQRLASLSVPPFRHLGGSAAAAAVPPGSRHLATVVTTATATTTTTDTIGSAPSARPATVARAGSGDGGLRQRRRPSLTTAAAATVAAPSHRRRGSVGSVGSSIDVAAGAIEPPPPPPLPPLHVPEPPGLPAIQFVESYSQPPSDRYAPTAVLDFISFVYALIFYQLVVSSARSLADITDADRRLPLDYLAALMLLFGMMVSERAVYMLGWPAAKMVLHVTSQVLLLGWCLRAYWQSVAEEERAPGAAGADGVAAAEAGVRAHLRLFVLLRCLGFCLGALQLRDGYPPLSAPGPAGGGRQSSFFYRRADWAHNLAFNIFYSLPFLYEIRTLLDWTCISTSLDWDNWLKLEDIRSSLFVATCRNQQRRGRRIGERVPRYVKFMQGVLALVVLLLVLWLPPLFFSSGAPTYQVPALQDAHLNISISKLSGGADAAGVQRFPLFATGDRRLIFQWSTPQPPPPTTPPPATPSSRPPPKQLSEAATGGFRNLAGGSAGGDSRRRLQSTAGKAAPPPPPPPPVPIPTGGRSGGDGGGGGSPAATRLPHALAGYAPDQAIGVCMAGESDGLWQISPPSRKALLELLDPAATGGGGGEGTNGGSGGSGDAPVVLEIHWRLVRSAPLASQRGGPGCSAVAYVPLSEPSRRDLVELLSGRANRTLLTALNLTDPASHGSPGLFPLFMRLKGDTCSVRLGLDGEASVATTPPKGAMIDPQLGSSRTRSGRSTSGSLWWDGSPGSALRRRRLLSWPFRRNGAAEAAVQASAAAAAAAEVADRWGAAMVGCYASLERAGRGLGAAEWWTFECGALLPPAASDGDGDGGDDPDGGGGAGIDGDGGVVRGRRRLLRMGGALGYDDTGDVSGGDAELQDACVGAPGGSAGLAGPPLVAVLEPVQSGLLGETLSRFGITGLYVTFVFAIGRFLRLSVSSLRLRIPTEDLPSTRRLVALCQDIYVARAEGELVLEEQLFRALINVYRSPELLFELSRKHKQA